jgi:methyl coenzyme M reductase subunit D
MKTKKSKVTDYFLGLKYCLENFRQSKFVYGITKTKSKLKDEVEAIEKASEEFSKERGELLEKHGEKDDKGRLVVRGNNVPLVDAKAYKDEFDKLKEKHKKLFDLLEEEIEFEVHQVDYGECPPDLGWPMDMLEEINFFSGDPKDIPSAKPKAKEEPK